MSESETAKTHLRDHLLGLLVHPISDGFWSIYATSKDLSERNGQPDQVLRTFQNMLTKIPEWSDSTLNTEVERIVKTTKCTYLDDLLMGVFIAYMKSFASLHYRGDSSHVEVDFDRPTMSKFIHETYVQSARQLWQVAYLFKTSGVTNEQQARNRQEIAGFIQVTIEKVIRSFLPWESIARQFSTPPTPAAAPPAPASEQSRRVLFEDEDTEDETEDEDVPVALTVTDEIAHIDIEDMDKDPLKEIESNVKGETLVLNL
jgi:hypothetical protein